MLAAALDQNTAGAAAAIDPESASAVAASFCCVVKSQILNCEWSFGGIESIQQSIIVSDWLIDCRKLYC